MTEKNGRDLAHETLEVLMRDYLDAKNAENPETMKSVLDQARVMASVVKQEHTKIALEYKEKEIAQRDRAMDIKEKEFEYKKTVTDPFEQQKTMAQLALNSRWLDLVEQGKAVGKFSLPEVDKPKAITTSESEVEEPTEIIMGVTTREEE